MKTTNAFIAQQCDQAGETVEFCAAMPGQPGSVYVPDTMDFACVSQPGQAKSIKDFKFDPTKESIADAAIRFAAIPQRELLRVKNDVSIPGATSTPVQPAEMQARGDAYQWAYEYLQSRMESLGRQGWAHDCDDEIQARIVQPVQPATHEAPHYLSIERAQGIPALDAGPAPVLYSDSINGCMVRRDDVWLALTSQLAQTVQPASTGFSSFLNSQEFYELMQEYRHTTLDAAKEFEAVIQALLIAISQPVADPDAHLKATAEDMEIYKDCAKSAQPVQPTQSMPLTDAHLCVILLGIDPTTKRLPPGFKEFARAIEAAHGIGTTPQPAEGET